MDRPLLSIVADSADSPPHQFTITYRYANTRVSATANVGRLLAPAEEESIRWYLEECRKFPFEPALTIGRDTAESLKSLGEHWFDQLFNATEEGRELWALAEEQMENTRIEVAADPARFAVPWEILWNPLDVRPVACRAGAFVRGGFTSNASASPNASGIIRILLVISRPAGDLDAPFRSVAARLLDRVDGDPGFSFEVLRPPTFDAFESALRSAAEQGRPYNVVHFDGHGVHDDLSARRENRPARRRRGYLLFETPSDPNRPDYISAPAIGQALATGGAPILILNACRSARAEIWTEEMGNRRPLGSLADELMRQGHASVVAMQYNVAVDTASRFAADLYQGLADRGSLAQAVQEGRRNLFLNSGRAESANGVRVHDWLVPVLFEAAPRSFTLTQQCLRGQRGSSQERASASVGGDDTLMAIERAFQSAAVVVLSGPVGCGKSTLAAEFADWDARTRDEADRARSPLHVQNPDAREIRQLIDSGARVLIETRAANFAPIFEHVVVAVKPLDNADRVALLRRELPQSLPFKPGSWQHVLAFSQGNPGVILNLAAMIANAPAASPSAVLESARAQPVGLDPGTFATAFSAFGEEDLNCLATVALFEGAVSSRILRMLTSKNPGVRLLNEDADTIFDRLSEHGLATPLGSSYYLMHPGLPGLLHHEFKHRYPGQRGETIRGAMVTLMSAICATFSRHGDDGKRNASEIRSQTLGLIEPTIRRTLGTAIAAERWPDVRNFCAALRYMLTQQGRRLEWRLLASHIGTLVAEDSNGHPPPGRETLWYLMQQNRIENLARIHSLNEAAWLQKRTLQQVRLELTQAEGSEADLIAKEALIPELCRLGDIRKEQREPDAAACYLEAIQIAQRLESAADEQRIAAQLTAFYLSQEPVDSNEVSYWLTYATELCAPYDRTCQARIRTLRGRIALQNSQAAEAAKHFQDTLNDLLPADLSDERAECELSLGQALSEDRASLPESMQHVQSAIAWYDQEQSVYRASCARLAASRILSKSGESARAFSYADEAARGFASLAPNAEKEASEAGRVAANLAQAQQAEKENP